MNNDRWQTWKRECVILRDSDFYFEVTEVATLQNFCDYLDRFAPKELAESWDNTGLLIGDRCTEINKVMTCLTITPEVITEATEQSSDLIVTHHPMMFRPINRITADTVDGRMLLQLIKHNVAVYSPHTAFDSTEGGINQQIADRLGLKNLQPLKPLAPDQLDRGSGRIGTLEKAQSCEELQNTLKSTFAIETLGLVAKPDKTISKIAIGCGSGGSFLGEAIRQGADALLTGETTFHTCLEAKAENVALFLLGHYASERFAVEVLAQQLQREFSSAICWPSHEETDPLQFV